MEEHCKHTATSKDQFLAIGEAGCIDSVSSFEVTEKPQQLEAIMRGTVLTVSRRLGIA